MSLAVAGVSLLVAGIAIARLAMPALEAWSDGKELAFGAIVIGLMSPSYLLTRWLATRDISNRILEN